jgi:hypothetical protein
LQGCLTIARPEDGVVYNQEFGSEYTECVRLDEVRWAPVIRFHCGQEAEYELKLAVESGAPGLAGIPQMLSVRYEICGMEYCVAQIAWLIGFAGCSIAGVLLLMIVVVTIRKRRRTKKSNALGYRSEELLN